MKKSTLLIVSLSLCGVFGFLNAATVIDSNDNAECMKTSTPVETTLCSAAYTVLTYNNPAPAGSVTITLEEQYIHDAGGLAWFFALSCGGGGAGTCTSGNVKTIIKGNGTTWGTIFGPSGGSVSPSLSPGTYNLVLDADVWDAGGSGCRWFGDPNCSLLDVGDNSGGTLTVTSAASVDLNIGMWFEKVLKNIFSSVGVDIAKASEW
ncbi:MAG: hypothetical protein QG653_623 [Patescibacteria group bacterium]|nr:hypothetical protein [Patescibacteria group bacterium]